MAEPASRATLIEVIILCCSKSDLKSLVGTDALRSVLVDMRHTVFPEPGVIVLQPLYDLLKEQPGFEHDQAVAPLCRLKAWEKMLEIRVDLPAELAGLDQDALDDAAQRSPATSVDLAEVLAIPAPMLATASAPVSAPVFTPPPPVAERPAASKRGIGVSSRALIAIAVAVLSVVAAGVSLYLTLRGETIHVTALAPGDISDQIPLTHIQRSGTVILATIADPAWIAKPEAERRAQLEAAAPNVRARDATQLMLLDTRSSPIGSLIVEPEVLVTFMPTVP